MVLYDAALIVENGIHWKALKLSRALALRIQKLKTDSSLRRVPQQIVFSNDGRLRYRVETVARCGDSSDAKDFPEILSAEEGYQILTPQQGEKLGIPGLILSFCYNPVQDSPDLVDDSAAIGFAFMSVKDLAALRLDRVGVVLLRGRSAEISFN